MSTTARLLIASQAPGTKVHASGMPWTDASGHRLRAWLDLTPDEFYDPARIAILPTGLCYPGRLPRGGDAPPRPECAPLWHPRLLPLMPEIRLTLLVGTYAQAARARAGRDGGPRQAVAGLPAPLLPAAAPVLAHRALGAAEPVVHGGGAAGTAGGGAAGTGELNAPRPSPAQRAP